LTATAWRRIVQAPAVPAYGYRYRRWVLDALRYVDVQDLATGGDHIPRLGDVYVDVGLVSQTADDAAARVTIGELLDRRSPVVLALIGQPGCGKSTLLAHAARRSAAFAARGHRGRSRVPVLLPLREQAESIVANPAISLPAVIRAAVGGVPGKEPVGAPGREPGGWWERQLRRGRCLILLDGLDEVARADDGPAVAEWIDRQVAAHPSNQFVVTSRSDDLLGPLTARADVLVARPFTAEQIQLFLDRWYLAAERHATGASGRGSRRAVRIRATDSAARLAALLREHPALHDLAGNPLLLTMIATAHRYRGALPGSRADLYGEICQVLLSRRAQAKDLPELLSWPAKQTLLAALAYQMMRDHVSDLAVGRVLEILGPQLDRYSALVTGEAFLDDVSRNGMLVEVPGGRYAFTHLTFQEYLAARHVSAGPDLVKTLADGVSDPWWHETILLYAATADASPIVRACLDSGTIPALTLAFDCDEASAEIDPELRQRLDRERRRAYEPGCSRAHRRLIAGVQAARLVRQTIAADTGTRICARPVPADLYWLFLADTEAPRPDSPCSPDPEQPAIGIWGTEAQAFVKWLNSITATATGIEVRRPTHDELQQEGILGALTRRLPDSVTSAWTQPGLELWVRPGQPHPHELTGAAIRQAVAADAKNTAMLPQILTATILDVAFSIARDLRDIRALSSALAGDLVARANSEGQTVDLMHAHARAIVLTYGHALGLARSDAIAITCAVAPDIVAALGIGLPRAMADAISRDLASAIDMAHSNAVELAHAIDEDLSILGAFDFDLAHAHDLARAHAAGLDRAGVLARDIARDPVPDLARVLGFDGLEGVDGVVALHPAVPLPGILGLPLRWIARGPLAGAVLQVLAASLPSPVSAAPASAANPLPADPYQAFALVLSSRAGISETTHLRAALGSPLSVALRDLTTAEPGQGAGASDWNLTGLSRLTNACAPISAAHQAPSPPEAAALRAVALALAEGASVPGSAQGSDTRGVLLTVAATVTLIENRSAGRSPVGESIILALA
jgi:hypothetical protein